MYEDMNRCFTLVFKPSRKDAPIIIHAYDTEYPRIDVEVRQGGKVIFPRGSLWCGVPRGMPFASDDIQARELVMSLVGTKPGDTDADYFEGYTPEQIAWAERYGEEIDIERMCRYIDPRDEGGDRCFSSLSAAKSYHNRQRRKWEARKIAEHNAREGGHVFFPEEEEEEGPPSDYDDDPPSGDETYI